MIYKGLTVIRQFIRKGLGDSVVHCLRGAAEIGRAQVKWVMKDQKQLLVKADLTEKSRCSAHVSDKINGKTLEDLWNQAIQDTRDPGKMSSEMRQAIRKIVKSQ